MLPDLDNSQTSPSQGSKLDSALDKLEKISSNFAGKISEIASPGNVIKQGVVNTIGNNFISHSMFGAAGGIMDMLTGEKEETKDPNLELLERILDTLVDIKETDKKSMEAKVEESRSSTESDLTATGNTYDGDFSTVDEPNNKSNGGVLSEILSSIKDFGESLKSHFDTSIDKADKSVEELTKVHEGIDELNTAFKEHFNGEPSNSDDSPLTKMSDSIETLVTDSKEHFAKVEAGTDRSIEEIEKVHEGVNTLNETLVGKLDPALESDIASSNKEEVSTLNKIFEVMQDLTKSFKEFFYSESEEDLTDQESSFEKGRTPKTVPGPAMPPGLTPKVENKENEDGDDTSLVEDLAGPVSSKSGILDKIKGVAKSGKLMKGLGIAAAAADVGTGIYDLANGERQTEMPTGLDIISPMKWGMYAGEKINQGVEATTGSSIGSKIYDFFNKDPLADMNAAPTNKPNLNPIESKGISDSVEKSIGVKNAVDASPKGNTTVLNNQTVNNQTVIPSRNTVGNPDSTAKRYFNKEFK